MTLLLSTKTSQRLLREQDNENKSKSSSPSNHPKCSEYSRRYPLRLLLTFTAMLIVIVEFTVYNLSNMQLLKSLVKGSGEKYASSEQYNALKRSVKSSAEQLKSDPIKTISLIGERNSGTKWMQAELKKCFSKSLDVKRGLVRDKHWFQYDDGKKHNKTLVVAMFRNPYDWIVAMLNKPHHSPNHMDLHWSSFVNKPWTMPRVGSDLEMNITKGRICQEGFRYNEVVSCTKRPLPKEHYTWETRWSERNPVYEMRKDGTPYRSILELRSDKIRNFLDTVNYDFVADMVIVQYEQATEEGTTFLIKKIEELTGSEAHCQPSQPQHRKLRRLSLRFALWMNKHVDWDTEALIGYGKARIGKQEG